MTLHWLCSTTGKLQARSRLGLNPRDAPLIFYNWKQISFGGEKANGDDGAWKWLRGALSRVPLVNGGRSNRYRTISAECFG
jgi:hypothetical protein